MYVPFFFRAGALEDAVLSVEELFGSFFIAAEDLFEILAAMRQHWFGLRGQYFRSYIYWTRHKHMGHDTLLLLEK